MKNLIAPAAFATLAALGTQASAGEITYLTYGARYDHINAGTAHGDFGQAFIGAEYQTGAFFFSGDVRFASIDLGPFRVNQIEGDALLGYEIDPKFMLLFGLEAGYAWMGSLSDTSSAYSVGLEYAPGRLTLGGYAHGTDSGSTRLVAYGGYEISEATTLAVEVERNGGSSGSNYRFFLDHERGPLDLLVSAQTFDFTNATLSVRATYEVNPRFRVSGNLGYSGSGGGSAVGIYSVGAGYQIADNVWLDGSVGAIDSSSGSSLKQAGISLTFETGSRHLMRSRIEDWRAESQPFLSF